MEVLLKIDYKLWKRLKPDLREYFTYIRVIPDDGDLFEDDEYHKELLKEYYRAKKDLQNYEYDRRNNDL